VARVQRSFNDGQQLCSSVTRALLLATMDQCSTMEQLLTAPLRGLRVCVCVCASICVCPRELGNTRGGHRPEDSTAHSSALLDTLKGQEVENQSSDVCSVCRGDGVGVAVSQSVKPKLSERPRFPSEMWWAVFSLLSCDALTALRALALALVLLEA